MGLVAENGVADIIIMRHLYIIEKNDVFELRGVADDAVIADERIARFDGSWLVPVNYGTTTLTADCGGFTAQCTVTVVRPEE